MKYDVGDGVRSVDNRDVVNRLGSGESHETYDSGIWLEAREV